MKGIFSAGVLSLLAPSIAQAAFVRKGEPQLSPKLEDKSDDKAFMKHDYPDDEQPLGHKVHEDRPFPAVQSAAAFDADYVKDENNDQADRATWDAQLKYSRDVKTAQEAYDRMEDKLVKEKQDVVDATKKKEQDAKDLQAAQQKEMAAADIAGKESMAEQDAKDAKKKLVEEKKQAAIDSEKTFDAGTADVEKKVSDLQACEDELKAAKVKLEELQNQAKDAAGQDAKAEELKAKAQQMAEEAEQNEGALEKTADGEKVAYEAAKDKFEKETQHVRDLTTNLAQAEERLRGYRSGSAPAALHSVKSSTSVTTFSIGALIASMVAMMLV